MCLHAHAQSCVPVRVYAIQVPRKAQHLRRGARLLCEWRPDAYVHARVVQGKPRNSRINSYRAAAASSLQP